jgi:hypothetical protein
MRIKDAAYVIILAVGNFCRQRTAQYRAQRMFRIWLTNRTATVFYNVVVTENKLMRLLWNALLCVMR